MLNNVKPISIPMSNSPTSHANAVGDRVTTALDYTRSGVQKYEAIVMENREPSDGNKIRFMIPELTPLTKGHLRNNPVPMVRKFKDARGRAITSRATHNNNFTAEYFSTDTFRKTPPDVQRGERIYVWQKGNTDYWYWEPFNGDSMSKRRLETVVQSVNADPPKGGDPKEHSGENTYSQEMSSQNKTWTVKTSKANGEVAAYTIQINAGEGSIILMDDVGNHIELDTVNTKIWMKNAAQTEVTLYENNIKINCNERMDTTVGTDQTAKVGGNVSEEVGGNFQQKVGGSFTIEVNGPATVKAPTTTIDSPNTTFTGNVAIKGALGVTGGTSLGGGGTADGSFSVNGNLKASSANLPGNNNIAGYRRA